METKAPKKMYGPGFNMILGLAVFKDFIDFTFPPLIIFGFITLPASFFAGVGTAILTTIGTFSLEAGASAGALVAFWPFILIIIQIFTTLLLFFTTFTYFMYNGVGIVNKMSGKYLARGSLWLASKFIPLINMVPTTTYYLLWVRKVENSKFARKHQKELKQALNLINKRNLKINL